MSFIKLSLLFAAAHLFLVITAFLCFGIGLEGKQHIGHVIFWALLMPAALFPLTGFIFILLNSLLWGFGCALLFNGLRRLLHK